MNTLVNKKKQYHTGKGYLKKLKLYKNVKLITISRLLYLDLLEADPELDIRDSVCPSSSNCKTKKI